MIVLVDLVIALFVLAGAFLIGVVGVAFLKELNKK